MTNKTHRETTPMERRTHNSRRLAALLLAMTMIAPLSACGKKSSGDQPPPTPNNVTLTAEQRQHIGFYTVAPARFHNSIDATGMVDFDNDQATSVLAPISGPVSRLLVSPGDKVRKGQPLCIIEAMKMMNEIESPAAGRVIRILAENGNPIEYGQPLMIIEVI